MPSTKKLPKKLETFFDSGITSYLSKTHDNKHFMYNIITHKRTPISKEYYNYRKFVSGNSMVKPIHIGTALALGTVGYLGSRTIHSKAAQALIYKELEIYKDKLMKAYKGEKNSSLVKNIKINTKTEDLFIKELKEKLAKRNK